MARFEHANLTRLGLVTVAGIALSGCSWLPFGGQSEAPAYHTASYGATYHGPASNCSIPHAQAPVPMGCDPAMVTVGLGGFAQQPQFAGGYGGAAYGAPQTATSGYGSHAGQAYSVRGHQGVSKAPFRSKLRGNLSIGVEKSVGGNYLAYSDVPGIDPELAYDPFDYAEGTGPVGSPLDGTVTETTWAADVERITKPDIAFDDVHSTPLTIAGGLEYALTPRTSAFANAGYSYSQGNGGPAIVIDGELWRDTRVQTYDTSGAAPVLVSDNTSRQFIPNVEDIANFEFSFTDMRRVDLEAGARHYFRPLAKQGMPRVSPFVSASAGASHFNAQSFDITQNQAFYERSFTAASTDPSTATDGNQYEVVPANLGTTTGRVDLYDSQWVPTGSLRGGLEWQATDRTAIAFETGVRFEGARDYSNGESGDSNISIPLTIRGSFNF